MKIFLWRSLKARPEWLIRKIWNKSSMICLPKATASPKVTLALDAYVAILFTTERHLPQVPIEEPSYEPVERPQQPRDRLKELRRQLEHAT